VSGRWYLVGGRWGSGSTEDSSKGSERSESGGRRKPHSGSCGVRSVDEALGTCKNWNQTALCEFLGNDPMFRTVSNMQPVAGRNP
jgi:hypothetical protein